MQNVVSLGHVPAVRASRALSFARRKSVTLAVISAALSVIGIAIGSDPLTYAAGFTAFGFVYVATECQKGGDK